MKIEDILRAEADELHGGRGPEQDKTGRKFNIALNKLNSAALCLSGGGIRSASFGLGVIQALASYPRPGNANAAPVDAAEKSLLAKFHYLSTVSGGGYIGSWLSAWRSRKSFDEIWSALVGRPVGPDNEPPPIAWLRSYSNYLTPKVGLMSADTWAALALLVRNLLLNWFVILPLICAAILSVKILGVASTWIIEWHYTPQWSGQDSFGFRFKLGCEIFSGCAALVSLVIALVHTLRGRPSCKSRPTDPPDQARFLCGTLLWSELSALFIVHFLASDFVGNSLLECKGAGIVVSPFWPAICDRHADPDANGWLVARHNLAFYVAATASIGAATYALAWACAAWGRLKSVRDLFLPRVLGDLVPWTVSGAVYGALVGVSLYLYLIIPDNGLFIIPDSGIQAADNGVTGLGDDGGLLQLDFLHLVFGVAMLLLSQVSADMIFVGLSSYGADADADREWFGRSAGWFVALALGWTVLTFLIFFGSIISGFLEYEGSTLSNFERSISAVGGISGLAAALFSRSGRIDSKHNAGAWTPYIMNIALPIVAAIFAAALIITISYLLNYGMFGETLLPQEKLDDFDWSLRFEWLFGGLAVSLAILVIASLTVDINRFSLHAVYRNRLIRAFLGASRHETPDPFTGFDAADNPEMHRLWGPVDQKNWRPLHVINVALNIVSSDRDLAWQERKAASFTVSPLHSGSEIVGFQRSAEYGGPKGISLGTAMAISGAAASPNMGYHSSPAITLLMTMFNVRLGWWLANPGPSGKGAYRKQGPAFAIKPLIQEAFGLTSENTKYVYLSDGGHFENLGLYEMVRRRCRYIVVSDAGCDKEYKFEDLGNAVRKIAIDLGVKIQFCGLEKLKRRSADGDIIGAGHPYHAIGKIDYPSADEGGRDGFIIYIKACYHGCESAGIRGYANASPDFPHESTINQWFTEAQLESYRALGFEITEGILKGALADEACATDPSLENIFATLYNQSATPPGTALR